jgi:hypothetical protein
MYLYQIQILNDSPLTFSSSPLKSKGTKKISIEFLSNSFELSLSRVKQLDYNSSIPGRKNSLCLCNHVHVGSEAQASFYITKTGDVEAGDLPPGIKLHGVKPIPHLILLPRFRICGTYTNHLSRLFVN